MFQRRSIPVCILLSIITCGIYLLYWMVKVTDELNYISGDQNATSGGMALLFTIITCGIYGLYWGWKCGEKVNALRARRGTPDGFMHVIFLVLNLFGLDIVTMALIQDELNQFAA